MRISRISLRSYRTLLELDLEFPSYYTAICGKNDSGKTNVVRAIRCLMSERDPYTYLFQPEFSIKDDFTRWVDAQPKERKLSVEVSLDIDKNRDAGLYAFVVDYLGLKDAPDDLNVRVTVTHASDSQTVVVATGGQEFQGNKADEILNRLRTSRTFLFHSATDPQPPWMRGLRGVLKDISEAHAKRVMAASKGVNTAIKKIAREQQQQIEELLGRLKDKYKVSLSAPSWDLLNIPLRVALGDSKVDIELDEWGSGTRNRTYVLLTILRAKQIAESGASAAKATPIVVVEEPESFLHPLAQAEFGRVLQDLATEFKVQIITTTHSPYLLSQTDPESNILLERKVIRGQLRHTQQVDTSGAKWMEPFAIALGINDDEFQPWRDLFFASTKRLLLVEGAIDKKYFELLRDEGHGDNRLAFDGEILDYGGIGNLKNQALLRFFKDKFDRLFITFDLDGAGTLEKPLRALGFQLKKTYMPIGIDQAGKRNIEGLLPDSIVTAVHGENPALVQALGGTADERRAAQRDLKRLLVNKFKGECTPGEEYFGKFYPIVKVANKALSG